MVTIFTLNRVKRRRFYNSSFVLRIWCVDVIRRCDGILVLVVHPCWGGRFLGVLPLPAQCDWWWTSWYGLDRLSPPWCLDLELGFDCCGVILVAHFPLICVVAAVEVCPVQVLGRASFSAHVFHLVATTWTVPAPRDQPGCAAHPEWCPWELIQLASRWQSIDV